MNINTIVYIVLQLLTRILPIDVSTSPCIRQIVFPLLYDVIVYFMTSQPMELNRFCMFCLMTILTSLVAQSVGVVIGAICDIQVSL